MRQRSKEVFRDVDFVRRNPMLAEDMDKLEFVAPPKIPLRKVLLVTQRYVVEFMA